MVIISFLPLAPGARVRARDVIAGGEKEHDAIAFVAYADERGQPCNGIAFWEPQDDGTHRLKVCARDTVVLPS